jgi:hypothetical protein
VDCPSVSPCNRGRPSHREGQEGMVHVSGFSVKGVDIR